MRTIDWSVYIVTDERAAGERALPEIVRAAIQGGTTAVQLRAKVATTREMVALGQALLAITRPAGIPLIVNDRLDVALAIEADGAHVGQDDLPAAMARQLLGPERILGVSAETVAQAQQAERDGANYLGVGDVFGTPSKPDAGSPIGIDGLAATVRAVALPVVAIGGITLDNAPAVIAVGAVGVAVISAVVGAADPAAAARQLRERISLPRNAQT
jgi:thiamine-phosphate pyrophosphorylase